jgi:hypothetical protein
MDIIQASNSLAVLRFPLKIAMLASLSVLLMVMTFGCGTSDPIAQENASGQASSAGIQVHGDWVITVRNPDGEIASTYEFENKLLPAGSDLLINLLAGNGKIEGHKLLLIMDSISSSPTGQIGCLGDEIYGYSGTKTLVTIPASIVETYPVEKQSLMLSGSCSILAVGGGEDAQYELRAVFTQFLTDNDPDLFTDKNMKSSYADGSAFLFTEKILNPKLSITKGQIIAFNVKLTFG